MIFFPPLKRRKEEAIYTVVGKLVFGSTEGAMTDQTGSTEKGL